MSYQVLARKWRPMSFAELSGQEHVVTALANSLSRGRVHHAYLLTGTRGVGKTTIARILAKSLNCVTGVTATPCGVCAACIDIDAGRFVDLLELDAASHTGIDNMREILDNARYAPTSGRYKVYLIDEVHMLSKPAFNSMLKTLEEPPEHVRFVLATTDPQKIPVTVLSRCLQFNLKPLTPALISARIEHILTAEKIVFEAGAVALLARAAHGSLRDGLSLLDQAIAFGAGEVRESVVRTMLGTVERDYLYRIADAIAAGNGQALLAESDALATRGLASALALEELASLFHRIAVAQVVPAAASSFDDAPRIAAYAQQFTPEMVQLLYQIAAQGRADLALAPDEATGFAMTLLRMLAFAPAAPAADAPVPRNERAAAAPAVTRISAATSPPVPGPSIAAVMPARLPPAAQAAESAAPRAVVSLPEDAAR
ncbi:MAG: DNA polymerase III subunit gamma/tau, partial [Casimicrobiaceae bacterium]